jgi:hypothetical protein
MEFLLILNIYCLLIDSFIELKIQTKWDYIKNKKKVRMMATRYETRNI